MNRRIFARRYEDAAKPCKRDYKMAVAVWRHGCRRIEEKGGGSRMVSAGKIKRIKNRVPNEREGGLK